MVNRILFLLAMTVIIASCKDNETAIIQKVRVKGQTLTEIHIDNIPTEVVRMNFSDLFTDFSIIPLETSDQSLMKSDGSRAWISDDNLFVSYQNASAAGLFPASLMRFDRNGNYLNRIGTGGKGPEEHMGYMLRHLFHNDEDKKVVAPWEGAGDEGPMIYNYDGKWLGKIRYPMEMLSSNIYPYSEDDWFWAGGSTGNPSLKRDSVLLVFFNHAGETTKIIPRNVYPPSGSDKYTPPGFGSSVYEYDGNYYLYFPGVDTIYGIRNRELIPSGIVAAGKDQLPFNRPVDPSSLNGKHRIRILAENNNNILLTKNVIVNADVVEYRPGQWGGSYNFDEYLIIIDKKTGKALTAEIRDDVFGLFPDVNLVGFFTLLDKNRLSVTIESLTYLTALKEKGIDQGIMLDMAASPMRLKSLDENSNPIVITFVLKDHIIIE